METETWSFELHPRATHRQDSMSTCIKILHRRPQRRTEESALPIQLTWTASLLLFGVGGTVVSARLEIEGPGQTASTHVLSVHVSSIYVEAFVGHSQDDVNLAHDRLPLD